MRITTHLEKQEVEMSFLIHRLIHYKAQLQEILDNYDVASPEKIEEKIALGLLPSHPAYEDYLETLAYKIEIQNILADIEENLNRLKSENFRFT